ncbi:unnamed protein product [Peniophora sp. CBMAI 1063]|nr:unnamed protein product [Peniophora sp. CBMAI 1063]
MNSSALRDILCDPPHPELLESLNESSSHKSLLPLLDVEIQRSSARLQRLREYRNALASPVYSLLPELLSRIFFIYAYDNETLFDLRWTKLLLVCRRWYNVAIRTPELWSFVQLTRSTDMSHSAVLYDIFEADEWRVGVQLSRAGTWPLIVKADFHPEASEAHTDLLLAIANRQRLSALIIDRTNHTIDKIVRDLADRPRPLLRTLSICNTWWSRDDQEKTVYPKLPDGLLRDALPHLSDLYISEMLLNWGLLRGLRSLRISFDTHDAIPFSMEDLIDALGRCPLLEYFQLRAPRSGVPRVANSWQSASLPRIAVISIRAPVHLCADVVQSVRDAPPMARIYVHQCPPEEVYLGTPDVEDDDPTGTASDLEDTLAALISYTGAHARNDDSPVIRSVSVMQSENMHFWTNDMYFIRVLGCLHAEQNGRELISWEDVPRHPEFVGIAGHVPTEPVDLSNRLLSDILSSWPLERATHLDMREAEYFREVQWDAVFSAMHAVTTVILHPWSETADTFIDYLYTHLRMQQRRRVSHIIFDAAQVRPYSSTRMYSINNVVGDESRSRRAMMRTLVYNKEASSAGSPLYTVEVINDDRGHLIAPSPDVDWSELYHDLEEGFVYQGVLYNSGTGRIGTARNSFQIDS